MGLTRIDFLATRSYDGTAIFLNDHRRLFSWRCHTSRERDKLFFGPLKTLIIVVLYNDSIDLYQMPLPSFLYEIIAQIGEWIHWAVKGDLRSWWFDSFHPHSKQNVKDPQQQPLVRFENVHTQMPYPNVSCVF